MALNRLPSESSDEYSSAEEREMDFALQMSIWNKVHRLTTLANFHSKLDEYFEEEAYTDVNIVCQGQVFRCHRVVLAAASEYFHGMFSGAFRESHAREVILRDVDRVTFSHILRFVYKGDIVTVNDTNVCALLRASEMLMLTEIADFCVRYLTQKSVPVDDALEIYLFASTTRLRSLIPATSKCILQNLDCFRRETAFLKMSVEDFGVLLIHFQARSASQEERLLNVILQWVCQSTDIHEDRRSSFWELAEKVPFKFVPALYVSEYFDRNLSVYSCCSDESRCSEPSSDCTVEIDDVDLSNLHVYLGTDEYEPNYEDEPLWRRVKKQTSIFTLRENGKKNIDWYLSCTIKPFIGKMRIVESGGLLYCLKSSTRWTFSSSTAINLSTDVCSLAPPSLHPMSRSFDFDNYDLVNSSLCALRRSIYLHVSHENVGFQCYNIELDSWSPVPLISEEFEPEIVVSDDTRLYIFGTKRQEGTRHFLALDPRTGKVNELCKSTSIAAAADCTEPGCYHKGKIYLLEDSMSSEYLSTPNMAIYDPSADQWDTQKLGTQPMKYPVGRRLVSFKNRLWMFGFENRFIFTQTYDSYRQSWNNLNQVKLFTVLSGSGLDFGSFGDVIAFQP